mmetsp:Transcript_77448/g.224725  ORF Transcript_77448/g.224725 Transcript_77448/m.224725 type:complete len:268 (+) Transcript_77448:622-1425(+)
MLLVSPMYAIGSSMAAAGCLRPLARSLRPGAAAEEFDFGALFAWAPWAFSFSAAGVLQSHFSLLPYPAPCLSNLCIACMSWSLSTAKAADFFLSAAFSFCNFCTINAKSDDCSFMESTTSFADAASSCADFTCFSKLARSLAQRSSTEAFKRVMSASRRSMTCVWFVRSTCWTVLSNAALSACKDAVLPSNSRTSLDKTSTWETFGGGTAPAAIAAAVLPQHAANARTPTALGLVPGRPIARCRGVATARTKYCNTGEVKDHGCRRS